MQVRRLPICIAAILAASLAASCATTRSVGSNIKRAYNGESVDRQQLTQAVASDTKDIEAGLGVLRRRLEAAYAQLKSNVQQHWGQNDTKVASRTVFVKYTQGYKSRVVTDFDHGTLRVETVDENDPQGSLRATIAAALLTSSDPAAVDLFTDKDVTLEAHRKPYLFGLVHDQHGKPIATREQAVQFANYLVPLKVQKRSTDAEAGGRQAWYVELAMVRNFELKGAERYRAIVEKYAAQYQVSPTLVLAIIRTESNFNPFAVSNAPAYGLMQLVPTSGGRAGLKRAQGVERTPTAEDLLDPERNIELGTAYLSVLDGVEFHAVGDPLSRDYCVIAAYNTGPRNVTRVFASERTAALNGINELPPPALLEKLRSDLPFAETRHYVVAVSGYRKQFDGMTELAGQPAGAGSKAGGTSKLPHTGAAAWQTQAP